MDKEKYIKDKNPIHGQIKPEKCITTLKYDKDKCYIEFSHTCIHGTQVTYGADSIDKFKKSKVEIAKQLCRAGLYWNYHQALRGLTQAIKNFKRGDTYFEDYLY